MSNIRFNILVLCEVFSNELMPLQLKEIGHQYHAVLLKLLFHYLITKESVRPSYRIELFQKTTSLLLILSFTIL